MAKKKSFLSDSGIPEIAAGVGMLALLAHEKKQKQAKAFEASRFSYRRPFIFPAINDVFKGGYLADDSTLDWAHNVIAEDLREKAEDAFKNGYGLDCSVSNVFVGPRIARIVVDCNSGDTRKRLLKMQAELEVAFNSDDVVLTPNGRQVFVDFPVEQDPIYEGDLFSSPAYRNAKGTPLAIGKAIDGTVFVDDLEKMPHLLIAGTTGSGKSVTMHGLILSVLMRNTPDDVELYMIDPKITEFQPYDRLGYCHAVGDAAQAVDLLRRLCDEMDARYASFSAAGVVNLKAYNSTRPNDRMPRKIVFIDELADLMNSAWKKTVEVYISRLSAKARAAGIHLVIATQYPTVKVITGQIKANITARIALNVATRTNSMVILDRTGAEKLQKHGDLLYMNGDEPVRIQAPMVERWEIEAAVNALAENQIDAATVRKPRKSRPRRKFFAVATAIILLLVLSHALKENKVSRIQKATGMQRNVIETFLDSGMDEEDILSYARYNAQQNQYWDEIHRQEAEKEDAAQTKREADYALYRQQREYDEAQEAANRTAFEERMAAQQAASDAERAAREAEREASRNASTIDFDEAWELLTAPSAYAEQDAANVQRMYEESRSSKAEDEPAAASSCSTSADEYRVNPVQPVINGSGFNEIRVGEQYRSDVYYNTDNRGYRMEDFDEFYYVNEH